ncbi:DNA repair protein RadA [Clostridiales bacterium]|nr:DNA repair protein RadA [Clostridiales bacterium]
MSINEKVFADLFSKPPEGNDKYILVVDDVGLQAKIWEANYCAMLIEDKDSAERHADIVHASLGGYVKDYVFLIAHTRDKALRVLFTKALNEYGMLVDTNAYKIFYKKPEFVYWSAEDIKKAIDEYIKNNTKSVDKNKGRPVCLEGLGIEKVNWLWWPYIPKGKLTIVQGDPGGGKTYSMLKVVAELSRGGKLPGDIEKREPIRILYQTAEDGYKDTINYRLQQMGADLSNIYMLDESEMPLSFTDERIKNFLKEYKPGLMVFDPIQAYLGAGIDMHRANEVRPVMSHAINLAEAYKCALAVITHMSKMTQAAALYRNLGSIDITAAARSVLVVGKDPEDPERKIIAQVKSSTAKHGTSIAFRINGTTGVEWDGYSDLEADDILNSRRERKKKEAVSLEEAKSFLIETLGDKEYEKLEVIKAKAEEAGIARQTLYNAKKELNIQSHNIGFGKGKMSWWTINDIKKEDLPHEPEQTKISELPTL